MEKLTMPLGGRSYTITVRAGSICSVAQIFNLDRRVLVLTDDGVPSEYAETVAAQCRDAYILTVPHGEDSKSAEYYFKIIGEMLDKGFDRGDCLVSVGGGVVGDLGGFAASTYMRGIESYIIPTTLLSMVDSSVGGKTAIDFGGYKNIIGAFHQPSGVIIDTDVLKTLDSRQFSAGMVEAVKVFATSDREMFEYVEKEKSPDVEKIIVGALKIKIAAVAADECESGVRKMLNFGHTLGHAVESVSAGTDSPLLHGECVGLGMLALTDGETRERIKALLTRYSLPTAFSCKASDLKAALIHDKKSRDGLITTVRLNEIGEYRFEKSSADGIINSAREVLRLL